MSWVCLLGRKGKEILGRRKNRVKGVEVRKDTVQCDQSIPTTRGKREERLNIYAALELGRT